MYNSRCHICENYIYKPLQIIPSDNIIECKKYLGFFRRMINPNFRDRKHKCKEYKNCE